ncbi:helix-turn-helix domain-containing protein [Cohnella sp. GCM10027633]|uniref:AraC family transcriptional regulator n=1 Tax=unclassified Cohnella TaxID=2636738 RepID=UPI0036303833
MRLLELKAQTTFLTHHACRFLTMNDVAVEWIDILFENAAGASYCPPHSHDWYEFNYVVQGRMDIAFENGRMLTMEAGTYVWIPPGAVHSHRYRPDDPHEGLCLRWRMTRRTEGDTAPKRTDEIAVYEKLKRLNAGTPAPLMDEIGLGGRLEELLSASEAGEQAIIVQMCFLRFLLRLSESAIPSTPFGGPADKSAMTIGRRVDIFLNDLQDRPLDVKALAASMHLSYAHVARAYKRQTGMTIIERMTEIKLGKAAELLLQEDSPLTEIAERTGFASLYYFSRQFKARYGVSPSHYRRKGLQHSLMDK